MVSIRLVEDNTRETWFSSYLRATNQMSIITIRWLLAGLLLLLFAVCTLGNLVGPVQASIRRKNYSMVPFIGGLAGMFGLLLTPASELQRWWWAPLVLDLGSGLLLLGVVVAGVIWTMRPLVSRITGSRRRE